MDILLYGFGNGFNAFCTKLFCFDEKPNKSRYDIIAVSEQLENSEKLTCGLLLAPRKMIYTLPVSADSVLTLGMGDDSTISFSSITYDTAMLSVNRCFSIFGSRYMFGERRVDFRENHTVYENLVLNALGMLL